MVRLSILDYAQIDEGSNAQQAIQESVELARHAERLGFHRFWVAEHHDVPAFASSSPEMLMMHLADHTETIRIGSGGVMLPHYSGLKIAENFQLLQAAHPGRIDLGMGNSSGTKVVNQALNEQRQRLSSYRGTIEDLKHYLTDDKDADFRFGQISANPVNETVPEFFLLSTSVRNAKMAAELGIGYCYGMFPYASRDKLEIGREATTTYREEFQASDIFETPQTMFALFAAIADTDEEAEALAKAIDLWMLGQDDFGRFQQFPSVEWAANYELTPEEMKAIKANRTRMVVATPETLREQLDPYIQAFECDEILLCTIMPGIDARKRGIELLAQAYL
ncbi:LLM class flavin-dependent oxidoreductase [Aerococcaceae bacterium DSM 111020]|nr:LLM class flavin-dependent oxidoreductase [Aerococcaceae bacterium DSM 111020]